MAAPSRTCVGCSRIRPQEELFRMVRGPEGNLHFDAAGRLPGRGAWLCPDAACLAAAFKGKRLRSAFHGEVKAPQLAEAREALARAFRERIMGLLGLAARSGSLQGGHDAAARSLADGAASLLITARDLSAGSREDILGRKGSVRALELGTLESLGAALGRPLLGTLTVTSPELARVVAETYDRSAAFGLEI